MSFKCLACTGPDGQSVYTNCEDYYLAKPYHADYYRCKTCGLIQQFPIPSDVSSFYDAYPIHQQKSFIHALMRRIIMSPVYFSFKALRSGSTLLDYGCGDGWFLESAKNHGLNVVGFERDQQHASRMAKLLDIPIYSDIDVLTREQSCAFDAVTMHFVLEHLPDLDRAFVEVHRLLKPGGIFYFVVPNIHSLEARLFKKKWHNLDSPRHLSFPDQPIASTLGQKHGFQLVRSKGLPFPNGFAGSLPPVLTGRFSFALFLLFLPLGILFSRLFPTGTLGCWLVKRSTYA